MIYISYKFCKDVVYKALEGNEIKLETFVCHNDNCVKMKFVTDKKEEWIVQFDYMGFLTSVTGSDLDIHLRGSQRFSSRNTHRVSSVSSCSSASRTRLPISVPQVMRLPVLPQYKQTPSASSRSISYWV